MVFYTRLQLIYRRLSTYLFLRLFGILASEGSRCSILATLVPIIIQCHRETFIRDWSLSRAYSSIKWTIHVNFFLFRTLSLRSAFSLHLLCLFDPCGTSLYVRELEESNGLLHSFRSNCDYLQYLDAFLHLRRGDDLVG